MRRVREVVRCRKSKKKTTNRVQTRLDANRTYRNGLPGFRSRFGQWPNRTSSSGSGLAEMVKNRTELNFGNTNPTKKYLTKKITTKYIISSNYSHHTTSHGKSVNSARRNKKTCKNKEKNHKGKEVKPCTIKPCTIRPCTYRTGGSIQ